MSVIIRFCPPLSLARFLEFASSPGFPPCKILEVQSGEYQLRTPDNTYALVLSDDCISCVTSSTLPCERFWEIFGALEVDGTLEDGDIRFALTADDSSLEESEPTSADSEDESVVPPSAFRDEMPELSSAEEDALHAIQIVAANSDDWIDVGLIRGAFAKNFRSTLESLDSKGVVEYLPLEEKIRLL